MQTIYLAMLNIQNIQRTHATQHQKISNLIKKWAEDLNMFPKKTYRWPSDTWKDAHITNHQEYADRNHNEVWPHTCHGDYCQKKQKLKVLTRKRKGNSCIIFTVETGASAMDNNMQVPEKTKRVIVWPRNHTPGHIYRENSNLRRCMHPSVHSSTIYNNQNIEAA